MLVFHTLNNCSRSVNYASSQYKSQYFVAFLEPNCLLAEVIWAELLDDVTFGKKSENFISKVISKNNNPTVQKFILH